MLLSKQLIATLIFNFVITKGHKLLILFFFFVINVSCVWDDGHPNPKL